MSRRLLALIAALLVLPAAADAATPQAGRWIGRSQKGEWVTFTVLNGSIHNFRISPTQTPSGDPELRNARVTGGHFIGWQGVVGYHGTFCNSQHMAGLRDARRLGDPNPLHFYAHREGVAADANPCPRESFKTPDSATATPGDGAWSGRTKNGADVVFTMRNESVLELKIGRDGHYARILGRADVEHGEFRWESGRGRTVKGVFCDANHMAGLIVDTHTGKPETINFSAHRNGHGQAGESPCRPPSV
jgi:hypothetical protein